MTTFSFQPEQWPFPQWLGPYSPSRGTQNSGFRFHYQRLGTWVTGEDENEFWQIQDSPELRVLSQIVINNWGGGRVLFLPNGFVIKPLQESDTGKRVLIGRFKGQVVLERPDGSIFNMSALGSISPGDPWPGPRTTGLECIILPNGALDCAWDQTTLYGSIQNRKQLFGPNYQLADGFRIARRGESQGRVRLTSNGHVITNRKIAGDWLTNYVGKISTDAWPHEQNWIGNGHP